MPESRPELAAALLEAGAGLNGQDFSSRSTSFVAAREQLLSAGVQCGHLVGLADMPSTNLLRMIVAAWSLNALPWPVSSPEQYAQCWVVLSGEQGAVESHGGTLQGHTSAALLHSTSGSTAISKTACRSTSSVLSEARGYKCGLELDPRDRVLVPVPVSHSFGSGVAISALLSGCDVRADHGRLPASVASDLDSGEVDKVAATPALAALLLKTRRSGSQSPKAFLIGAGVVSPSLASSVEERFHVSPIRGYGSTETGGTFIGPIGLGAPIDGVEIVWPPLNSEGELVLRTSTPTLGYLSETPRVVRVWRTGDVVRRDGAGVVAYLRRRNDDQVRLNGRFVDLTGLQAALEAGPGVREHTAVVLPDRSRIGAEVLYIVVATDELPHEEITRRLTPPVVPLGTRVVTCAALPRTALGKLDRGSLVKLVDAWT